MDAGGRAAGDRAPRDEQDPPRRRSRADRDARLPRRGAAEHRVGLALRAAHRARGSRIGHRDPRQRRRGRVGGRGGDARRHVDRGGGPLLQPAGAPQVPEVRRRRVGAGLAHRHAAGALLSGGRLHADERRAEGAAVPAGGVAARSPLSAVRRADRPGRGAARRRRRQGARLRRGAGGAGADARAAERVRQPPHRQGPDDRARDHRRLQRGVDQGAQPRGAPVHRDAARRGGRQRAPDEGRGALSRPVVHPRGGPPDARRRARPRTGAGAAARGAARSGARSRRRCRCRTRTPATFPSRWATGTEPATGRSHRPAKAVAPTSDSPIAPTAKADRTDADGTSHRPSAR